MLAANDPVLDLGTLTHTQRLELASLLDEVERRQRTRLLETMFPDTGPLRRALYPKHTEFFRLGATNSERVFMAGNRVGKCITGHSEVDTPSGPVRAVDLREGDEVWAWDGAAKVRSSVHAPFKKAGLHECALILMSDGRWVEAADHHRIFVNGCWRLLSECLPESFFCHRPSNSGCAPSTRGANAPRLTKRLADWLRRCSASPRQCDVRPPTGAVGGQSPARQPADVLQRTAGLSGDLRSTGSGSPLSASIRASTLDVVRQNAARCAAWLTQAGSTRAAPNPLTRLAAPLLRAVAGIALRSMGAVAPQALAFLPSKIAPFDTPDVDGTTIIAVIPIGRHEVYDFTVPGLHCYCAAGLVHHNTVAAGTETSYHLTGRYPNWWDGHRFNRPIRALASGDTHETTRDIIQLKLVGSTSDKPENYGTGLIPGDAISGIVTRTHVKGAIERVMVKHISGGESELWLRSYEQGREIFQGFELDLFWPDEECPEDVYEEGQVRLMTRDGISMLTFTPLNGLTTLVQALTSPDPDGKIIGRAVVQCGWDDVPHLSAEAKAKLLSKLMPHQRDARTKGVPALGSGAIYPVPETDIVVPDFALPDHWPRAYGMDVGWNRTAAVWGAIDREADVVYLYSGHYRGQAEPSIHADAIKARGDWIPGAIDPASRGRSQKDGEQLLQNYVDLGLSLTPADNGVESGIYEVWQRMSTGRMKVFASMRDWLDEYRIYRRDDKGRIVKERDHLMDATRYLQKTGLDMARIKPRVAKGQRSTNWRTA